ncbi:MAG: SDR family oxidoreductase [Halioglobus sp.]
MLLENKVAIVSGIGPGMGRDISLALAAAGADVVLAARSEDKLLSLKVEIEQLGGRALAVVTDIGCSDDCQRLADRAMESFGRVDILVNNAYFIGDMKPFETTDIDSVWRQVLDVNLLGYMRLSQSVVPLMKAQGGGSIVMINSVSMCGYSKNSAPVIAYASSKAALNTAALYMAGELGQYGIRVNSVRPGYIDGDALGFYCDALGQELGLSGPDYKQKLIDEELALDFIPHSRDIAQTVLYLASDMSSAVTGQTIDVNAGERMAAS